MLERPKGYQEIIMDDKQKKHIFNLIDWLVQESLSSGGDGDAIWYSRFFTLEEILPILEEYNKVHPEYGWTIQNLDGRTVTYGQGQECIIITTNNNDWLTSPEWIQAKIRW